MRWNRLVKFSMVVVILLASWSCSLSASDREDGLSPAGASDESEITLPDYPLISRIETEPKVVSPEAQVVLTGPKGLSGTLTFTTPSGGRLPTEFLDGSGMVDLQTDAPAGQYFGMLETESGVLAFSSFRVAGEPGVWLSANRGYASAGQQTLLTISASELPPDVVAAVYLGQISDGAPGPFVPNENGVLVPGDPAPLDDLIGQPLLLPINYEGEVQVGVQLAEQGTGTGFIVSGDLTIADDPPAAFDGWTSNLLQLRSCEQPGSVRGDLGGPGFVNVIWVDGSLRSDSTYTTDGSFTLEAGPGMVLVQMFRVDLDPLPEPESQVFTLGCGESLELAHLGSAKVASLASAWPGTAPGSFNILSQAEFPPPRPASQSSVEEPCRTGLIFPSVRDEDGLNRRHSTLAAVALKTALTESASRADVNTVGDALSLLEAIAERQASSEMEQDWESLWEAVQSMSSSDFVISLNATRSGRNYFVNTAALPVNPEDAQVRASSQGSAGALFDSTFSAYAELAEQFSRAAICGSAEPERAQIDLDEELTIQYRVTDLSGEGVDGASVRITPPKCGRLDPDSGSVEGEAFETRFTYHTEEYCAEKLEFEADWTSAQGTLKTKPEETIVHISPQLPELALYAGAAPGIGNTASLATAITLYEDYDVRDQPASLPGFTQDPECGFLEGGLELANQYFFTRSESVGKRAESLVTLYTTADEVGASEDVPVNRILMRMQLDTWAIEIEDDNVIRGAWASGANHSDPNLTRSPGTLLVFDLNNPGNLPTTPIVSWQLGGSIDDASAFTVLVFYKVINCGDEPGIGSLFSFVADGDILLESDNESPGPPTGIVPLPEFMGDRQQIIMWVTSLLTTASIRDDDAGADLRGRARLHFQLGVNLAQETG